MIGFWGLESCSCINRSTDKSAGTFLSAKTKIWQKIKKYYQHGTQYRNQPTYSFLDVLFHCYITLYSYTFDFGCEVTIQICQMVTEHQEKSIKRIDYCYSFYFSNIFRPFSVSIYFCFGCFGLSGYFMETNPSTLKKTWFL